MLELIPPYIFGAFYSLIFVFAVGPAFFYLISLGITKGFKCAAVFALGVILSDIIITFILYIATLNNSGDVFQSDLFHELFSILGGLIIAYFGVKFLTVREISISNEKPVDKSYLGYSMTGLFMNLFNPFSFIAWLFILDRIKDIHSSYSKNDYIQLFAGLFIFLTVVELTKAYFANKISNFITPSRLLIMNKILGGIFIFLASRLFYHFGEIFFKWNFLEQILSFFRKIV